VANVPVEILFALILANENVPYATIDKISPVAAPLANTSDVPLVAV